MLHGIQALFLDIRKNVNPKSISLFWGFFFGISNLPDNKFYNTHSKLNYANEEEWIFIF